MNTNTLSGRFRETGVVYSNDPIQKRFNLVLTGNVRRFVDIKPSGYVRLLSMEGATATRMVEFTAGEPGELLFTKVEVSPTVKDKITTNLVRGADNRTYRMEVASTVTEIGSHQGDIIIHTNSEQKPQVTLKVLVEVRGPIQVTPNRVHFGRLKALNEEPHKLRRTIWVRKLAGEDFRITGLEYDTAVFRSEIQTRKEGEDYLVFLFLLPEVLGSGLLDKEVMIRTDHSEMKVLHVPVLAEIE